VRTEILHAGGTAQGQTHRPVADPQPAAHRAAQAATRRQLPIDLLPDTPERPALVRLHQLVTASRETAASYAGLRERLRGLPEENIIENAASELLGLPFDEEGADSEFRDTLEKLQEGDEKRAFAELQIKAQQFGVAGLSAEEKQAYIQFLTTKAKRS
jgi:DNA primase